MNERTRRVAAFALAAAALINLGIAVSIFESGQADAATIPVFLAVTLCVGSVSVLRRWYGVLFGWGYPASIITGFFGASTALELVHQFDTQGRLGLDDGCLGILVFGIGVMLFAGVCAIGALLGMAVAKQTGAPISEAKSRKHAIAIALLFTIVTALTGVFWTPWPTNGGGCF